jgi:hypothetical protein
MAIGIVVGVEDYFHPGFNYTQHPAQWRCERVYKDFDRTYFDRFPRFFIAETNTVFAFKLSISLSPHIQQLIILKVAMNSS